MYQAKNTEKILVEILKSKPLKKIGLAIPAYSS
jgi:hypothetical protein